MLTNNRREIGVKYDFSLRLIRNRVTEDQHNLISKEKLLYSSQTLIQIYELLNILLSKTHIFSHKFLNRFTNARNSNKTIH